MRKIILIGNISDYERLSGPANVVTNLYNNLKNRRADESTLINTYTRNIFQRMLVFLKILALLFKRNLVVNVHTFGYLVPYLVLLISKINKRNQYVLTIHGLMSIELEYSSISKMSNFYKRLERDLIVDFPNLIVVSNLLKEQIINKFNRTKHISVIYNGVSYKNDNEIKKNEIGAIIKCISAGGISNLKSTFELLEFVKKFNQDSNIKIDLTVCGNCIEKHLLEKFENFIVENNLQNYIRYLGILTKFELEKLYKGMHLCFCISKYDTFNITALESMSFGTPGIISKQCGVSEIIEHGNNGYLINMNKNYKEELNAVMREFKNNLTSYNKLSKNAQLTCKKFNWGNITDQYLEIFKTISL